MFGSFAPEWNSFPPIFLVQQSTANKRIMLEQRQAFEMHHKDNRGDGGSFTKIVDWYRWFAQG